ncbi:MAG: BlaI/MecI/CopY family transcriptional regulator [Xanthomonadales bacterium]|nr:BlaI/MecI/CopY family transcriptional regulator [Xanthomonadales bacterium]
MRKATMKGLPRPTEAELGILRILWDKGPSTVREVHEVMNAEEPTGYTTALKLLQVMHAKGLVERDDSQRAHIYQPSMSKDYTQHQFVTDLVTRVFDGSPSELVLHALGNTKGTSKGELAKIRQLIEELEKESR